MAVGGFVDGEDKRRKHHFTTVRISVGDRSCRCPIWMGINGFGPGLGESDRCPLLSGGVGKIQAQLLVAVDRDGFGGLDYLERQG